MEPRVSGCSVYDRKQDKGLESATTDLLCYASSVSAGIVMVIDHDL